MARTISSFCSQFIENSISDMLLLTAIMLSIVTRNLKLEEGDLRRSRLSQTETQGLFRNMMKRFQSLTEISEAMNAVIGKLIPLLVSVDCPGVVSMINDLLNDNYTSCAVYAFRLVKDGLAIYIACTINAEVT